MGSMGENVQNHPDLVSLAALMSRELRSEKMERPSVRCGCAAQSRKGEDYFLMKTDCQRVYGNSSTNFSVFGIFDGHNGDAAAIYSRDNLLNHVLDAIPPGLPREEWLQALPRAMVAGLTSGTTATFVIIDGWTVTVASVGDSRCILDTPGGSVSVLTVDHRLEENTEERERVTASGGEVGRLNVIGGPEMLWVLLVVLSASSLSSHHHLGRFCRRQYAGMLLVLVLIGLVGGLPAYNIPKGNREVIARGHETGVDKEIDNGSWETVRDDLHLDKRLDMQNSTKH
ncbi:hypothetical protein OSB04_008718 [Centaurea solstitialis]|uniref:PPM-type phosphatase domain-containing protein n=1 Tax=Centaurea solstitialis TaxID=347529 RepID=A0AA38U6V3_9ASTR|nr:hypothetical protein OSB04_008718 [Centaurea solstitialis]